MTLRLQVLVRQAARLEIDRQRAGNQADCNPTDGVAGESIPGNRGELYTRFVSRMLRRDTDRRMDAEIPERLKRRALADLTYHLGQGQRR